MEIESGFPCKLNCSILCNTAFIVDAPESCSPQMSSAKRSVPRSLLVILALGASLCEDQLISCQGSRDFFMAGIAELFCGIDHLAPVSCPCKPPQLRLAPERASGLTSKLSELTDSNMFQRLKKVGKQIAFRPKFQAPVARQNVAQDSVYLDVNEGQQPRQDGPQDALHQDLTESPNESWQPTQSLAQDALYQDLDKSQTQIRLLEIVSANDRHTIKYRLHIVSLKDDIQFSALSYV